MSHPVKPVYSFQGLCTHFMAQGLDMDPFNQFGAKYSVRAQMLSLPKYHSRAQILNPSLQLFYQKGSIFLVSAKYK